MKSKSVVILLAIFLLMGMLTACNVGVAFQIHFVVDGEIVHTIDTLGNEKIKMPNDPTKEGYLFDGWYWDKDVWEKPFTVNSLLEVPLSENMSVYAKWKPENVGQTYTITLNSNGGSEVASITKGAGESVTEPTAPTKAGYLFDGWYTDNNTFQNEYTFTAMPEESFTLYASWTEDQQPATTYTITFNSNGGSEVASITKEAGESVTEPTAPTKTGFAFNGWYTDNGTFLNVYEFSVMPAENITLYAKWTDNTPEIVTVPYSVNITQDNIPEGAQLVVMVFCGHNFLGSHTETVIGAGTVSGEITVSALLTDALSVEVYLFDANGELLGNPLKWQYRGIGTGTENPTPAQIISAYISAFRQMYVKGLEYAQCGMPIQSAYALSWAASAVSSLRLSLEHYLSLTYDSSYVNESKEAGLPIDYERIAAFNYACPYAPFFHGLHYEYKFLDNPLDAFYEEAQLIYPYALSNPDFVPELDNALKTMKDMTVEEMLTARAALLEIEAAIFECYTPKPYEDIRSQDIQRFDPAYWREKGKDCLEEDIYGYRDFINAYKYFEVALLIDPFDGDNFALSALTCYYLSDYGKMAFFINHGLYAAPDHEGLNALYELLKAREEEEW